MESVFFVYWWVLLDEGGRRWEESIVPVVFTSLSFIDFGRRKEEEEGRKW